MKAEKLTKDSTKPPRLLKFKELCLAEILSQIDFCKLQ